MSVCPPAYYAHLVAARARFHGSDIGWNDALADVTVVSGVGGMIGSGDVMIPPPPGMGGMVGDWSSMMMMGGGGASSSSNRASMMMKKRTSFMNEGRPMAFGVVKPELTKVMYWM